MYPKSLVGICIDRVVSTSKSFLNLRHSEVDWTRLRGLWATLWHLPQQIPRQASRLLHAHLSLSLTDISSPMMALLVTGAPEISFSPTSRQLAVLRSRDLIQSYIDSEREFRLEKLDLTGVDLGLDTDVLENLLRKCPRLSILKLGGNTTPQVLEAARQCPLRVLHLSERLVWNPRISEADLWDIFFGLSENEAYETVKPEDIRLTWPFLSDLCTGFCRLKGKFFVLIFIAYGNLSRISSKLIQPLAILDGYTDYRKRIPNAPTLKLKHWVLPGLSHLNRLVHIAPEIEDLTLLAGQEIHLNEHLEILKQLSSLKVLRLRCLRHIGQEALPFLSSIGVQLRVLEIHTGMGSRACVSCLPSLLTNCPQLREIILLSDEFIPVSEPLRVASLPELTSITCQGHQIAYNAISLLLQWFPYIQRLTLIGGKVDDIESTVKRLDLLANLRILKLMLNQPLPIQELCNLPKTGSENFELHVYPCQLSTDQVLKLEQCGWIYIPRNDYDHV